MKKGNTPRESLNLEEVQLQFELWRNDPERCRRIPPELWDNTVSLCSHYSTWSVSRTLRLSFNELKVRVQNPTPSVPDFLKLGSSCPSDDVILELQDRKGRHLRLQWKGAVETVLPGLVRSLGRSHDPDHPSHAYPCGHTTYNFKRTSSLRFS
jgi:hypothetical protein